MGVEVKIHKEKIDEINDDMEEAKDNVAAGKDQLEQKKNKGLTQNKWLVAGLIGVGGFVFVLLIIILIRRR